MSRRDFIQLNIGGIDSQTAPNEVCRYLKVRWRQRLTHTLNYTCGKRDF